MKHSPIINNRHKVFPAIKIGDVLASQRTDNKIVETLREKYHTKGVCLGDIGDIWLGDVIENVRMIKDPYGEKTGGEKYRKDEVNWECLVLQLTEVLSSCKVHDIQPCI